MRNDLVKKTISLTPDLNNTLGHLAADRGVTDAEMIRRAIILVEHLEKLKNILDVDLLYVTPGENSQIQPLPNL